MRLWLPLATILILLAPATLAHRALPDAWRASGDALWDDGCLGELTAGSFGPMPTGEHAGQYWFWMDVAASVDGCASVHREGWIHSPHADSAQIIHADGAGGSMVTFWTDANGARSFELYEWSEADGVVADELVLVSRLAEQKLDGARLL